MLLHDDLIADVFTTELSQTETYIVKYIELHVIRIQVVIWLICRGSVVVTTKYEFCIYIYICVIGDGFLLYLPNLSLLILV